MNVKKIFVLLLILIIYVNYVMHFKKEVSRIESTISSIEQRIVKEEILFKEKDQYKEMNSTKEYSYLFYDGKNFSYSSAMGTFQQDIQSFAKEANCTISNIQWQDMPQSKERWYDVLRLRVSLECTPKAFVGFQNYARAKSKFFIFNQITLLKKRRKNLLTVSMTITAYRSKKNEQ
ncbi:MAG: hypothetical protein U9O64_03550 [Campylobacterota bacterium]|nr:hypothetical protein [Campylobacterota bacterium]